MLLLEGQRAVPKHLQDIGFQFHHPEAEGALRDLFKIGE
jgi:NAD dependent epimerase/dehydratase family enzyme